MKIAQVVCTFPPQIGGMGQVAFEESKRLAELGHAVTVFTLKYSEAVSDGRSLPFKVVRFWPIIKGGDAGLVPQLFFKLKNFDVVHLHYPFYGGAEWVWLARMLKGQKYVVTYHMDAVPAGTWQRLAQKAYDGWLPKLILRGATKVVAVDLDHFNHSHFGKYVLPEKVTEVFNGVDTNIFKPEPVDWSKLDLLELKNKKIILFVGNPLPFKRLDFLFEAVKMLSDSRVVLLVVSGGYKIDYYKTLAKDIGVADSVRFVGRVSRQAELNNFYNAAACLVVPSASAAESFSLVLVEALSAGCPVIAADTPGVRRRVSPGVDGLLFEPHSAANLAAQILSLTRVTPPERAAMAERGRAKMVAHYTWVEHVKKLQAVYCCCH